MNFNPSLTTPVGITPLNPAIQLDSKMMLLGSCFSQYMGEKLIENKLDVQLNPYGIQYNPISILCALQEIMADKVYQSSDLVYHNEQYHSMMHHGDFSHEDKQVVLQRINDQLHEGYHRIKCVDWLVITWGTAWVYEQQSCSQVVSNCHKIAGSSFQRRKLSVEEIVQGYVAFFDQLFSQNTKVKVLFTVSPIRHLRDNVHENQLSKSILLLAQEQLKELYPERIHYFPAYEILLDELRDYRFYDVDMTHPSIIAQQIIWNRFVESCLSQKVQQFIDCWMPILKQMGHRPQNVNSESHQSFLSQLLLKIETISAKFPILDCSKEIQKINAIYNKTNH